MFVCASDGSVGANEINDALFGCFSDSFIDRKHANAHQTRTTEVRHASFASSRSSASLCSRSSSLIPALSRCAKHTLPDLPYDYNALEPVISGEIMKLHHQKHHATYVNNLNVAEEKYNDAKTNGTLPVPTVSLRPTFRRTIFQAI